MAETAETDAATIPPEFVADAERIWANVQHRKPGTRYVVKVEVDGVPMPPYIRWGVIPPALAAQPSPASPDTEGGAE